MKGIFENVNYNGKFIGIIWQDEYGWACESDVSGSSWDCIDTRDEAIRCIIDDWKESSPDVTHKSAMNAESAFLDLLENDISSRPDAVVPLSRDLLDRVDMIVREAQIAQDEDNLI